MTMTIIIAITMAITMTIMTTITNDYCNEQHRHDDGDGGEDRSSPLITDRWMEGRPMVRCDPGNDMTRVPAVRTAPSERRHIPTFWLLGSDDKNGAAVLAGREFSYSWC